MVKWVGLTGLMSFLCNSLVWVVTYHLTNRVLEIVLKFLLLRIETFLSIPKFAA